MQRKIEKARRSEEKRNDETKEVGKGEQVFPLFLFLISEEER